MTAEQKVIDWQAERIKTLEKTCRMKQAFIEMLWGQITELKARLDANRREGRE